MDRWWIIALCRQSVLLGPQFSDIGSTLSRMYNSSTCLSIQCENYTLLACSFVCAFSLSLWNKHYGTPHTPSLSLSLSLSLTHTHTHSHTHTDTHACMHTHTCTHTHTHTHTHACMHARTHTQRFTQSLFFNENPLWPGKSFKTSTHTLNFDTPQNCINPGNVFYYMNQAFFLFFLSIWPCTCHTSCREE